MNPTRTSITLLVCLASALSVSAHAQELWVTRSLPARLDAHSSIDGTPLATGSIDLDTLVGFAGVSQFVWDVERGNGGEIWVSNYTSQQIHRISQDGTAYLGDLPVNVGRSVGIAVEGNHLWVASVGGNVPGGVYVFDRTTWAQLLHVPATNIWDVHASQGRVLISRSTGVVEEVQLSTGAVLPFAGPGGFCEQISDRIGSGFVVANFSGSGYWEVDGIGMVVATHSGLGIGSVRGVASLANGLVLLNSTTGAFTYDLVTGATVQVATGNGCFIAATGGGGWHFGTATRWAALRPDRSSPEYGARHSLPVSLRYARFARRRRRRRRSETGRLCLAPYSGRRRAKLKKRAWHRISRSSAPGAYLGDAASHGGSGPAPCPATSPA
jgi:hypothetical protein